MYLNSCREKIKLRLWSVGNFLSLIGLDVTHVIKFIIVIQLNKTYKKKLKNKDGRMGYNAGVDACNWNSCGTKYISAEKVLRKKLFWQRNSSLDELEWLDSWFQETIQNLTVQIFHIVGLLLT